MNSLVLSNPEALSVDKITNGISAMIQLQQAASVPQLHQGGGIPNPLAQTRDGECFSQIQVSITVDPSENGRAGAPSTFNTQRCCYPPF
jgi:hypothetical protein